MRVSNAGNSITSNSANLTILVPPSWVWKSWDVSLFGLYAKNFDAPIVESKTQLERKYRENLFEFTKNVKAFARNRLPAFRLLSRFVSLKSVRHGQ